MGCKRGEDGWTGMWDRRCDNGVISEGTEVLMWAMARFVEWSLGHAFWVDWTGGILEDGL